MTDKYQTYLLLTFLAILMKSILFEQPIYFIFADGIWKI